MPKSRSIHLAIILTALLGGCSSPKQAAVVNEAEVDAHIRSVNLQLEEAIRQRRQMMGDDDIAEYADGTDTPTDGVPATTDVTLSR